MPSTADAVLLEALEAPGGTEPAVPLSATLMGDDKPLKLGKPMKLPNGELAAAARVLIMYGGSCEKKGACGTFPWGDCRPMLLGDSIGLNMFA